MLALPIFYMYTALATPGGAEAPVPARPLRLASVAWMAGQWQDRSGGGLSEA